MHIHILGICGTFMGGIALLARAAGHRVTGSDLGVYPPMSDMLQQADVNITSGYDPQQLTPEPDLVIIGNALSRGNACVEYILNRGLRYTSGAQWLAEQLLYGRWVLAVAGTHGKTTTASMLVWILKKAGLEPGYLIGGVPGGGLDCAELGQPPFFVIEADEYDCAFFDKRSKFVHYSPKTLIVNNLEYDHADIFADLGAIQAQFHHLIRTVPSFGRIIYPGQMQSVLDVLDMGCWSALEPMYATESLWRSVEKNADCASFEVFFAGQSQGIVSWSCFGEHNMRNALMAIAAARHVGVRPSQAIAALASFSLPKKRLEKIGQVADIIVYDDFAHHPTAIQSTLSALRGKSGEKRIIAVFEPRSNSMKMGVFNTELASCFHHADEVFFYASSQLKWDVNQVRALMQTPCKVFQDTQALVNRLVAQSRPGDQIIVMSNGDFGGIQQELLSRLEDYYSFGS